MIRLLTLFLSLLFALASFAQETDSTGSDAIENRIFMPSFEVGYMWNGSEMLSGGSLAKFAFEYRFSNINNGFLRVNFDTRSANYFIGQEGQTDVLEGSIGFTDLIIGGGYRGGNRSFRFFVLAQAGVSLYDYPLLERNGNNVRFFSESRNVTVTRATVGMEYYFDDRTAFALELLQDQVINERDFWTERQ